MRSENRTRLMTGIGLVIYVASAVLFTIELLAAITGYYPVRVSYEVHELIELSAFIGFLTGGLMIWRSHRLLHRRNHEVEQHLKVAQGEFFKMLELQFDRWGLSSAERDIALLTVKGLSVAEIASLRETSQGTVKSQNSSIYRKAGVRTRTQLLGVLIDELLVVEDESPPA